MVKVGIIGLGGMGSTHFRIWAKTKSARIVAMADGDEDKLKRAGGELDIGAEAARSDLDPGRLRLYTDADELVGDPEVEVVDICLPTFAHAEYSIKAIEAAKHVLCEKPMAMNTDECRRVLAALEGSPVRFMVAHCLRFWPEYVYLKEAVESARLGRLNALSCWRGIAIPEWSWQGWMRDSKRCGGAVLDLHVHDVDFIHYLLGKPRAVCSSGKFGPSGGYDAVDTVYIYGEKRAVTAGASWLVPAAMGFRMQYFATFDKGALQFDTRMSPSLLEITESGGRHPELPQTDGYHEEIAYFVDCIEKNELPAVATPESSAFSVELVEAEKHSLDSGQLVEV